MTTPTGSGPAAPPRRRRLRAVFAADVANYGGLVAIDETRTLDSLSLVRRIATETLAEHGGWLFGLPGDGVFALFESAIDAVRCGLDMQSRLAGVAQLDDLKLRIGIHLGEVVFENELPFGEALVIAARLESLAEPGGVLVSSAVRDAVALRINARFEDLGVRPLKHSPREINTFGVSPGPQSPPGISDPVRAPEPVQAPDPVPTSGPDRGPGEVSGPAEAVSAARPEPAVAQADAPAQPAPTAAPAAFAPAAADRAPARPPRDPKDRSILPSLPPARPLVVPDTLEKTGGRSRALSRTRASLDRTRPAASTAGPPAAVQACVADLAAALTVHLGPIARVLVQRAAQGASTPLALAERLGAEVKNEAERRQFMEAARRIIQRIAP